MPPHASPSHETPATRLLDAPCACGHHTDRHESGPDGRGHGCRAAGCPCARWYRLELVPGGLELVSGEVRSRAPKAKAS